MCPLYRGLDILTDWNPTRTIAQQAAWPRRSPTTQQLATLVKQTEILEAVRRGLVTTAVYILLRTYADDPRPRQRTCNGRPLPRPQNSSPTAPTNTCSTQPPCP